MINFFKKSPAPFRGRSQLEDDISYARCKIEIIEQLEDDKVLNEAIMVEHVCATGKLITSYITKKPLKTGFFVIVDNIGNPLGLKIFFLSSSEALVRIDIDKICEYKKVTGISKKTFLGSWRTRLKRMMMELGN